VTSGGADVDAAAAAAAADCGLALPSNKPATDAVRGVPEHQNKGDCTTVLITTTHRHHKTNSREQGQVGELETGTTQMEGQGMASAARQMVLCLKT
jgi:hypothetical protein